MPYDKREIIYPALAFHGYKRKISSLESEIKAERNVQSFNSLMTAKNELESLAKSQA